MSISEQLNRLEVRDGDVLRVPYDFTHEQVSELAEALKDRRGVVIVCGDLDVIDEAAMNAAGWYRQ